MEPTIESEATHNNEVDYEPKGVVDLASVLYVVCGIPCMILFFVVLFGLVGACDSANMYIPA